MSRSLILFFCILISLCVRAETTTNQLSCFLKVYPLIERSIKDPNVLVIGDQHLIWHDGINDKSFETKLSKPTIADTLSLSYRTDVPVSLIPEKNQDPGRFRNDKLLSALYGDSKTEIRKNLVRIKWIRINGKARSILFNKQQGAAHALENVVKALNQLPAKDKVFLQPMGGTFNYRKIAGTNRLSAHSYGIAIDINPKKSLYWRWTKLKSRQYPTTIPKKIIEIFEANGFIWGGRWHHFDTMHFEYRPEILKCT